ncbi:dienelactone hydrolase family protein [Roseomonas sp. SSH11]|uniref:Dienelactone hydrolase family protein n=1 Tax=Pararoseomonas baculiformis TaxID=2820812 RepID=A0ABS4AK33_9PROT|nr:dienelactone hydrolase family protein [Pararoseomonas baculiformis]MBP0447403.1 dienelactone hydrolase family protein [Pararoseomonas baculiformis]
MPRRVTPLRLAALLAAALLALPATAQTTPPSLPGRVEVHPLRSTTLSGAEFLRGGSGPEASLAGELRLPPGPATTRVPAVILVHGSGGISGSTDLWARQINEAGMAAFILDSFAGRGITSTVTDQDLLHSLAMMVDAYRALDLLAAHPRIRADRTAVMGFSKGAVAAVYSASERFRRLHGSQQNRFAAHIGLYTPCNVRYQGDTQVAAVPIRLHHGVVDDYVPIAPCRDYVERLRAAGADAAITEYPNGQHSFDNPAAPALVSVPNAQSTRNCRMEEGADGAVNLAGTSEPFAQKTSGCVARGAHVGHDPNDASAVRANVRTFLTETLLR